MPGHPTTLLDRRRASAVVLSVQFKDGGHCHCCGYPFAVDPPHPLTTKAGVVFMFVCETCWRMTSPMERLELFEALWKQSWSKDAVASKIPLEDYVAAVAPQ